MIHIIRDKLGIVDALIIRKSIEEIRLKYL